MHARFVCLTALLVLTALSGCSTLIFPKVEDLETYRLHVQDPQRNTVLIEYKVVSDIRRACASTGVKDAQACAMWSYTLPRKCTIYVATYSTEVMLGHELRHCFEGHFH